MLVPIWLSRRRAVLAVLAVCSLTICRPAIAQTNIPPFSSSVATAQDSGAADTAASPSSSDANNSSDVDPCDISAPGICLKDFLHDQVGIWTSPLHVQAADAIWLLPLAAATAVSLHYDVDTLQHVSTNQSHVNLGNNLSNAAAYGAIGVMGASYLTGKLVHNEHARETGVLSLEAVADSLVVTEAVKFASNRERPYVGSGQGRFWPNGFNSYTTSSSFPSAHATVIWSISRVVSYETPGHTWFHLGLYAIATGVDVARVTSRNHFPSDVIVGSAIGYLTGGYVFRAHSPSAINLTRSFTISPVFDAANQSFGIGVTADPEVFRSMHFKTLLSPLLHP